MIVSAFTQNRHVEDSGALYGPFDHVHCATCVKRACNIRPDDISSCKMVDCPRACGARYHACKEWEHQSLCPEERVPCINQGNGCPSLISRSRLGQHLARCPASVVFCTAEWNRSPMCPPKLGEKPFLPKTKKLVDCGQLDVALAMRDHRALIDMLQAPRRTRRILRNPLTQRYPAAPFGRCSSQESDFIGSEDALAISSDDDDEDLQWDTTRSWLSTQSGVHIPLYQASRQTATSLTSALDFVSNHMGQGALSPHEDAAGPSISDNVDVRTTSSVDEVSNLGGLDLMGTSLEHPSGAETDTAYNIAASSEHLSLSVATVAEQASSVTGGASQPLDEAGPSSSCKPNACVSREPDQQPPHQTEMPSLHLHDEAGPSTSDWVKRNVTQAVDNAQSRPQPQSTTTNTSMSRNKQGNSSSTSPDAMNSSKMMMDVKGLEGHPLFELLGVNLGVECITKYQPKQSYMYTFLCGQEFRRDQFPHHFHNVHNEIQSGLSGWMEQRCPLAYLGCPFSFRRFCPDTPDMSICHSWLHESFGLQSRAPEEPPSHQTPECLIPASVETAEWSSNVDQTKQQSSIQDELSLLEPKCVSSGQKVFMEGRSVDVRVSSASDIAYNVESSRGNVDTTPAQNVEAPSGSQQSHVDSVTSVLPSASCLSNNEVGTSETDSFSALLESIVLQGCVDSTNDLSSVKLVRTDMETSCDGINSDITTMRSEEENQKEHHHENCPMRNMTGVKSGTVDKGYSAQILDSQTSFSIPSLKSEAEADKRDSASQKAETPSEHTSVEQLSEESDEHPVLYTGASANSLIRLDHRSFHLPKPAPDPGSTQLELADLPIEILQHIAWFLDSFSLYNLSLVSRLLRDICCSLLDERGIVCLIWERKRSATGVSWQVVGKRWSFSLSFQTVHKWQFSGHNPISPHLLTCPYNRDKLVRTDRFSIIPQNETPSDLQIRTYLEEKERQPSRPPRYLPNYITWVQH